MQYGKPIKSMCIQYTDGTLDYLDGVNNHVAFVSYSQTGNTMGYREIRMTLELVEPRERFNNVSI